VIEGDGERALRIGEELQERGEPTMYILFGLLRQLRQAYVASALVSAGRSTRDVQAALGVPTFIAKQIEAQARSVDPERLERALDLLAELDYAVKGGGDLDEHSALTLVLAAAAGTNGAVAA
jgi:DNA polymerase III delta subunit